MHSAIFLIATLLGIAGLYLHLHAEFLAAVQVILYVGGIMVLFLFVIMLVDLDEGGPVTPVQPAVVAGAGGSGRHAGRVGLRHLPGAARPSALTRGRPAAVQAGAGALGNTQAVGNALYQNYMLPFEIASIMLLVAMVGAVVMAKKQL